MNCVFSNPLVVEGNANKDSLEEGQGLKVNTNTLICRVETFVRANKGVFFRVLSGDVNDFYYLGS